MAPPDSATTPGHALRRERRRAHPRRLCPENVAQALMSAPWRVLLSSWPWRALGYLLISAVLALLLVPIGVLTILLLPLWGILCGMLERRRQRMLGFPAQPSGHVRVGREQRHNWLNIRLTEPATWREVVVLLVDLVAGAIAVTVLVAQAMMITVLVVIPFGIRRWGGSVLLFGEVRVTLAAEDWWRSLPPIIAGLLVVAVLGAYLNLLVAAGQSLAIRWLLAPRGAEIDERIERLTRSRAAIVTAHAEERRRIERDLHDGVQQELVVLASRLGVLELELAALGPDAAGARTALAEVQSQAERASASLRDTVRGIHPAVLVDHGLGAALDELAGRMPVPVRIDRHGLERADPGAEAAAYFLVTEALTNVVKHTDASMAAVSARTERGILVVSVLDDGRGGADPAAGTGLAGLVARAAALDGTVRIDSPLGGPTRITMEIPVGSSISARYSASAQEAAHADPVR